jgi:hypothetical protein
LPELLAHAPKCPKTWKNHPGKNGKCTVKTDICREQFLEQFSIFGRLSFSLEICIFDAFSLKDGKLCRKSQQKKNRADLRQDLWQLPMETSRWTAPGKRRDVAAGDRQKVAKKSPPRLLEACSRKVWLNHRDSIGKCALKRKTSRLTRIGYGNSSALHDEGVGLERVLSQWPAGHQRG